MSDGRQKVSARHWNTHGDCTHMRTVADAWQTHARVDWAASGLAMWRVAERLGVWWR